jgi:hypothetical protein
LSVINKYLYLGDSWKSIVSWPAELSRNTPLTFWCGSRQPTAQRLDITEEHWNTSANFSKNCSGRFWETGFLCGWVESSLCMPSQSWVLAKFGFKENWMTNIDLFNLYCLLSGGWDKDRRTWNDSLPIWSAISLHVITWMLQSGLFMNGDNERSLDYKLRNDLMWELLSRFAFFALSSSGWWTPATITSHDKPTFLTHGMT